jgi:hypothetical protein
MHARRLIILLSVFSLAGSALAREAPATLPSSPTSQPARFDEYLRFVEAGNGRSARLETSDVTFRNKDGATVHLVSAVHIGEASYFRGLAKDFEARDAVLYEMVKPRGTGAPEMGVHSNSGVSQLQRFLKDTLDLEFQLDVIDYTRPNFVHADLDAETFQQMQEDRGESFATLMLKQLVDAMSRAGTEGAAADTDQQLEDLVKVFTRPDSSRQLKLMIARNMAQMENTAMGLSGADGTVIVTERNKACIAALRKALSGGKKDVAIFYGAAHMPDLSARLEQLGFMPVKTEWRLAWDLAIRADQPSAVENALMELIHGFDDLTR